jgi:hypothetical protein
MRKVLGNSTDKQSLKFEIDKLISRTPQPSRYLSFYLIFFLVGVTIGVLAWDHITLHSNQLAINQALSHCQAHSEHKDISSFVGF